MISIVQRVFRDRITNGTITRMVAHSLVKIHVGDVVVEVSIENRDRLSLKFRLDEDGVIRDAKLSGSGCSDLLKLIQAMRPQLRGPINSLPIPPGTNHAAILMRELLLKAKGEWKFPYGEDEVCHCRGVSTARVDQAIIGGCHSVEAVKKATSAGSSCGTCRMDVECIIKYRLQQP